MSELRQFDRRFWTLVEGVMFPLFQCRRIFCLSVSRGGDLLCDVDFRTDFDFDFRLPATECLERCDFVAAEAAGSVPPKRKRSSKALGHMVGYNYRIIEVFTLFRGA